MEIDAQTGVAAAGIGGVLTWAGQAIMTWAKNRHEKQQTKEKADLDLEKHRDNLTFEILQEARSHLAVVKTEVEDLRREVKVLRGLEKHFFYFEQSLDHLEAILHAEGEDRIMAERNGRAFLNRMRRLSNARGTIRNEIQRAASEMGLADLAANILDGKDQPAE